MRRVPQSFDYHDVDIEFCRSEEINFFLYGNAQQILSVFHAPALGAGGVKSDTAILTIDSHVNSIFSDLFLYPRF